LVCGPGPRPNPPPNPPRPRRKGIYILPNLFTLAALLAALDHAEGVVLAQRVVDGKSNEITAFAPLLDGIDIAGAIITTDALHTQREQ